MTGRTAGAVSALALLGLASWDAPAGSRGPAEVDAARLTAADREPGQWMSYGRTYSEQRYSPLTQVNAGNASKLGLAWSFELATNRGVEVTPVVVDGVMYVTSSWSLVYALDARTGKRLWTYDPEVPRETGFYACCDVVNRGVAVWQGKVYVATLDGRLVALDARTGKPVWTVRTTPEKSPYTITMAPRIVRGKVMIGNSGSEYGVRGYVSAYDAQTGKLAWRFYTVPGDPSKGFENKAMEMAAKTWKGEWWKAGGGGSPWDAMSYDPETNLLYFGTGNGAPWNEKVRSAGEGDNLFLSSIVAVNADTGEYAWHYQTTPGDSWDFDSTQSLVLADLPIGGRPRKVLMQAAKNGFFYVLDRTNGQLISAEPFVKVTWAKGVDKATGRPIEIGDPRYKTGPAIVEPSSFGGHNWHPMSFSPKTGLAYVPAQEVPGVYGTDDRYAYDPSQWNTGTDTKLNALPSDPKQRAAMRNAFRGYLEAIDPLTGKIAWKVEHKGPWNGGTLATAGDLVFQGTADGRFNAYEAKTGKLVWSTPTYAATLAGPMTYSLDGEQYVAVGAGFGSVYFLVAGFALDKPGNADNGKILVYKLGGRQVLPKPQLVKAEFPKPPPVHASAATIAAGQASYQKYCLVCHGYGAISGGVLPDLRKSPVVAQADAFKDVVIGGVRKEAGMVSFASVLKPADADAVRAYLLTEAQAGWKAEHAKTSPAARKGPKPG